MRNFTKDYELTIRAQRPRWGIVAVLAVVILVNFYFVCPREILATRPARLFFAVFDGRLWPAWYSLNLWIVAIGFLLATVLTDRRAQGMVERFYCSRPWRQLKDELKTTNINRIFVGAFLSLPFGKRLLRRWIRFWRTLPVNRYSVYAGRLTVLLVLYIFLRNSLWITFPREMIRHLLIRHYYRCDEFCIWFFYGAWVDYLASGVLSWRMLTAPLFALALIVFLLKTTMEIRSRRKTK